MTVIAFDTFKYIETLRAAGIPEVQARALLETQKEIYAEAVDHTLATKADMIEFRADLRQEMGELKADLRQEMGELKAEVKQEMGELKSDNKLMKWMVGSLMAGVASIMVKVFCAGLF